MDEGRGTKANDEIYCPECGEPTPRSGVVCGHCGTRLARDSLTPPQMEARAREILDSAYLDPPGAVRALRLAWRLREYDSKTAHQLIGNALGFLALWLTAVLGFLYLLNSGAI